MVNGSLDPTKYAVTALTRDGGSIDLDDEAVFAPDGHRVTEAETQEFTARRGGRPSLGERGTTSPAIAFRLPAELRRRAEHLAEQEGKTLSALAREALESRLRAS